MRASDIKPSAEVDLIFRKHHYEIEGNTAAQLFAQMNELGPPDPGKPKHSFPGVTRTRFGWDVDESQPLGATRERCMIESVDIYLDVWITLPRWEPPGSASQAVVAEWSRFLDRLRFHELGHKDIALRLAREAALAAKGLVGLCGVVSGTAEKRIAKILAGEEALHRSFDRSTRHGATQGAYLNLST